MIVRAMKNLHKNDRHIIPKGTVFHASLLTPSAVKILLHKGLLTQVSMPPLQILPVLSRHVEKLQAAGIETIEQFLEANFVDLALEADMKPKHVLSLQNKVMSEFSTPQPHG